MLGDRFGVPVRDVLDHARFRRVRIVRSLPGGAQPPLVTPETLSDEDARAAVIAAGGFLARGVDAKGRFRYLVDAPTNRTLPGYDWPRHAGATYFLTQAAAVAGEAHAGELSLATLRAASFMRDHAMVDCGTDRCIGDARVVDVGSAALAVIAFAEIARTKLDPGYASLVPGLTAFLRAQQKPDGEFMHRYDRTGRHPIDVQLLYYSGEAALALSRANALLGDPRDLDGARRALAYLVGPGWSFFGSRYYFGEEHWTCQVMDDLWDRSPDRAALDFCDRWQAYGRRLQHRQGDTLYDADGAYGIDVVLSPRFTPVASRCEAAVATLDAAERAGMPMEAQAALVAQIRRSLALLLRHQFRARTEPLLADPAAVEGAMPASAVDWELRIDFAQHMGSALIRWLNAGSTKTAPGRDTR
jgi:hypothetical protein